MIIVKRRIVLVVWFVVTSYSNSTCIAFTNFFLAYEYILTLPFTQVNCERSFSKLKIIKNRLRSSLGQDKLEAFMLISVEKELLEEVTFQDILKYVKQFILIMFCIYVNKSKNV